MAIEDSRRRCNPKEHDHECHFLSPLQLRHVSRYRLHLRLPASRRADRQILRSAMPMRPQLPVRQELPMWRRRLRRASLSRFVPHDSRRPLLGSCRHPRPAGPSHPAPKRRNLREQLCPGLRRCVVGAVLMDTTEALAARVALTSGVSVESQVGTAASSAIDDRRLQSGWSRSKSASKRLHWRKAAHSGEPPPGCQIARDIDVWQSAAAWPMAADDNLATVGSHPQAVPASHHADT